MQPRSVMAQLGSPSNSVIRKRQKPIALPEGAHCRKAAS